MNDYSCRIASAITPELKEQVAKEAARRDMNESTFLRWVLEDYFRFSHTRPGNPVYDGIEEGLRHE